MSKNCYKNISRDREGILHYTGRILPSQKIDNELKLADVCIDLTASTFCVPLLDKASPISYAIVNDVHWHNYDAKHAGNETVMRYVQLIAYIIEGRSLIKQVKKDCPRCRYIHKKAIDVAMGPVSCDNLRIAPPFYVC